MEPEHLPPIAKFCLFHLRAKHSIVHPLLQLGRQDSILIEQLVRLLVSAVGIGDAIERNTIVPVQLLRNVMVDALPADEVPTFGLAFHQIRNWIVAVSRDIRAEALDLYH